MSATDSTDMMLLSCANCGKGEEDSNNLKSCAACKLVKYCSRDCQVAHRPQHKKECKKRAAELYDEKLFKDVEREECPICMLPLSFETGTASFQSCCGKCICIGCDYAMRMSEGKDLCAFCRTPAATSNKEHTKRTKKLMQAGNANAFNMLGFSYAVGKLELPQDYQQAIELYLKAGELGCAAAYYNLGQSYREGTGIEVDEKKAKYYYELAAMGGDIMARNSLAAMEGNVGNNERAKKHLILAAKAGFKISLVNAKEYFMQGIITKDEYESTLRAHQKSLDEMKSDMRDKAELALASGMFR